GVSFVVDGGRGGRPGARTIGARRRRPLRDPRQRVAGQAAQQRRRCKESDKRVVLTHFPFHAAAVRGRPMEDKRYSLNTSATPAASRCGTTKPPSGRSRTSILAASITLRACASEAVLKPRATMRSLPS